MADNYIKLDTANKKLTNLLQDSLRRGKININQFTKLQIFLEAKGNTIENKFRLTITLSSPGANIREVHLKMLVAVKEPPRIGVFYTESELFDSSSMPPLATNKSGNFYFSSFMKFRAYAIYLYGFVPTTERLSYVSKSLAKEMVNLFRCS